MANIGFDIDGVCYKFVDALRNHMNTVMGVPNELMQPATRWEFYEDWGYSLQEYKGIVAEGARHHDLFWRGEAYEGCKRVIDHLFHVRGDEITFITSRHLKEDPNLAWYATYHWLNNEIGLPYHKLILSDDKFGHGFDVLFDDAPYQYEKQSKAGERIVVFDQLWNMHLTEAERVYGWDGVLQFIEQEFPNVTKTSAKM